MLRTHSYHPRITFQDTNVVGNVYFLSYFRWQFECFEEWRRQHQAGGVRKDESAILYPTHICTSFSDPVGATVGDCVQVATDVLQSTGGCSATSTEKWCECGEYLLGDCSASSTIKRIADGVESVLATGTIIFSNHETSKKCDSGPPKGPCYEYRRPYAPRMTHDPLDLLSVQGKCRELFLLDHAPETIRRVAGQDLALQTTSASVDILSPLPEESGEVKVELRLEALKCGQMTVRFDYFELDAGRPVHFAYGQQRMSCKRRYSHGLLPTPLPADVLCALRQFTDNGRLLEKITDIERFSERAPQPHSSDCVP